MDDTPDNPGKTARESARTDTIPRPTTAPADAPRKHISMHENVPVWYDCCSCEAEPYWAELAEEPAGEQPAVPAGRKPG